MTDFYRTLDGDIVLHFDGDYDHEADEWVCHVQYGNGHTYWFWSSELTPVYEPVQRVTTPQGDKYEIGDHGLRTTPRCTVCDTPLPYAADNHGDSSVPVCLACHLVLSNEADGADGMTIADVVAGIRHGTIPTDSDTPLFGVDESEAES